MSETSKTGTVRHIANQTDWRAVCTAPDYCKVGNSIVGFDSFAFLSTQQLISPNVKAQCVPVYRLGDLVQGVQGDAGSHIVSGTSLGSGYVKFTQGQSNVKVNGLPVVRDGNTGIINCNAAGVGGAPCKVITEQKSARSQAEARPPAKTWWEQAEDEAERAIDKKWQGIKEGANTLWQAIPFVGSEAERAAARDKIGDGILGGLGGLGTLMGPDPEMIQAAYLSGNPESIALVEKMQQAQLQAVDAVADHVKKSWDEAHARNGTVGAASMVLTTLGMEVATTKGMGTLAKTADMIADIVRVAKTPLEAASLLDREINAAKLAGKTADEIKLLEKARDERLAQVAKEADATSATKEGVHVKKAPIVKNGYTYHFDDAGRVAKVEGELKLNKAQGRNTKAQLDAGGADRLPTDQGGHFAGRRFDGPMEDFNHFAQNGNFNNSAYKKLENSWQKTLENGGAVKIEIVPNYPGGSLRPNEIIIKQWIDGVPQRPITFGNVAGGGITGG
jgi:predicted ribonuclease toxin of YeeF-YezG toxin-antitoxin module